MVRNAWQRQSDESLVHQMRCNADNVCMCGKPCCQNPRRNGWSHGGGKTIEELQPIEME